MVELESEPKKSSSQKIIQDPDPCVLDVFLVYSRMQLSKPGVKTDFIEISLAPFPSKGIVCVKGFRG